MDKHTFDIRFATNHDIPTILEFIRDNAEVVGERSDVVATKEQLAVQLFGIDPCIECLIVTSSGSPIGQAIFYKTFSSYLCQTGLYLEEVYIAQEYRGCGAGQQLLNFLAALAHERGYCRIEWSVHVENELAKSFYRKFGAEEKSAWRTFRLGEREISNMATSAYTISSK